MKILFVGATGSIGSEVLEQCLARPEITSVVAFSRRELPSEVSTNSKLQVLIKKDFSNWPKGVLEPHADAEAMVWMMGTYAADEDVLLKYPLAFQHAFLNVLKTRPGARFRDIHLSGRFVVQDQERSLWFLPAQRKIKGRFENEALAFAAENASIWKTFSVRPAAVVTKKTWGGSFFSAVLGDTLSIKADALGAFVARLAVRPDEESGVILNHRMAVEGKEALEHVRKATSNSSG